MKTPIFAALLIISALISGCATPATSVITGKARPQFSADAVQVYSDAPTNSEIIGTVSVVEPNGLRHDSAIEQLKIAAGKMGANGLVMKEDRLEWFVGYHENGLAIFVP